MSHLLRATWFVMAGGDRIVATGAGSRPGTPWQMSCLPCLLPRSSAKWMLAFGRLVWFLICLIRLSAGYAGLGRPLSLVTWHDLAILLTAASSQDLLQACATATAIVHDTFRSRQKRKTEILLSPQGQGRGTALTRACSSVPLPVLPD